MECPNCHSSKTYRNGYNTVDGQRIQRWFCRGCEKTFQADYLGYEVKTRLDESEMLELYEQGKGYGAIAKLAGVSRERVRQILTAIEGFEARPVGGSRRS